MLSQEQFNKQKRRAKRRSLRATENKKTFRMVGAALRVLYYETPRNLWHPENW